MKKKILLIPRGKFVEAFHCKKARRMGCGASNPYATFEGTIKGDDKWVSFTKKFDISKPEAKKLFLAYQKMDKRKTGEASFKDFCRVWNGGAEDEIIGRFFLQIDKDEEDASGEMTTGNDVLYFQEWVVMTYDFLTLRTDGLVDCQCLHPPSFVCF